MKILFCINALTYGGAQNLLLSLANKAKNEKHSIIVIAFKDGPIKQQLLANNIPVHILGESWLDIPGFFLLVKIIRRFKPDIIHSHLFKATIISRIANSILMRKSKLITSIHGSESFFLQLAEKFTQKYSEKIVFPSKFLRNWYLSKISSLSNGRVSIIHPGAKYMDAIRSYSTRKAITLGTLSRLHPVKGIEILIEACSILKNKQINFRVLIGGDGSIRSTLEEIVEKHGLINHISFSGEISETKQFLEQLDIFIAPSKQEAFGIHVCEAMERGLAVIASRIGGLPEIIIDKKTGYLFQPENSKQLAEMIEILINDSQQRRKIGNAARESMRKNFNRKQTEKLYLNEYNKLISSNNRHVHFIISSSELGGGERLAIGLMTSLKLKNWHITATCSGFPLSEELTKHSIPHSVASMKSEGIFFMAKVANDIRRLKPSIISSHLNKASLFSGILGCLLGIPVISHVHGLNKASYYNKSSHLIAVSQAVCKHLIEQGISQTNITTLPNCITPDTINKLSYKKSPLTIAIIAKLHKNKGHEWALRAIAKHVVNISQYNIWIFGDGPERANLETLCKEINLNARFFGFISNVADYYPKISVALLPSLGEGIPLSLLETMRCGIPAIATNVGGIPEIIENDYNGFLIEPGDENMLRMSLERLENKDELARLRKNSFIQFIKINKHSEMINTFENILEAKIQKL